MVVIPYTLPRKSSYRSKVCLRQAISCSIGRPISRSFVARGISLQPKQENAEKEAMDDFL
jgi:hypothetical protein